VGLPSNFRRLRLATGISNLGDGIRLTALPLLATRLTSDPRLIAGVAIADRVPWLVFILPGGALADRLDRLRMRIRLDLARTVVSFALVTMIATGHITIPLLYLVTALLSSAEAIVDSSSMAIVPSLVGADELEHAGGQMQAVELITNGLVGPPVGGLLLGVALAAPFAVDASSFLLSALVALSISGSYTVAVDGHRASTRRPMRSEIADGLRWLWHERLFRSLALWSTVLGTVSFIGGSVFVVFAKRNLRVSDAAYGLLLIPPSVGGVFGAWLAPRLRSRSLSLVLSVSIASSGIAYLVISRLSSAPAVGLLLGVTAVGTVVWNVLTLALRQRLIPNELLGRVGASYRFLVYIGMPFGALAGGLIANSFGPRTAIAVVGAGLLATGIAVKFSITDTPANPATIQTD